MASYDYATMTYIDSPPWTILELSGRLSSIRNALVKPHSKPKGADLVGPFVRYQAIRFFMGILGPGPAL